MAVGIGFDRHAGWSSCAITKQIGFEPGSSTQPATPITVLPCYGIQTSFVGGYRQNRTADGVSGYLRRKP